MSKNMNKDLREPIDYSEQLQYEQLRRLGAIMEMLSSIVKYIADKEGIATEKHVVIEPVKKPRKKKVTESK